ncbi:uncharacterized protein B0T23DRAFT_371422 [Neurospora hispaniola]|uniref:Uncharacterized protein n=1 Tax=Neurospora hispaniola TaxID=588809 RepID=A0AAJ0MVT0_9PEZI|nr:hypothetical protein B0T23DRAFT_371422 [Neurospora hispaniola]
MCQGYKRRHPDLIQEKGSKRSRSALASMYLSSPTRLFRASSKCRLFWPVFTGCCTNSVRVSLIVDTNREEPP